MTCVILPLYVSTCVVSGNRKLGCILGEAMALHDDRNEQAQRKWYSRLARGRLDLSVSVEETLEENASQSWQEGLSEQDSSMHTAHGMSLIPPRLSLQSKLMPAVHSGSFIESASYAHPALMVNPGEEQKQVSPTQNANMLVRFAQRLTSSLAVFGVTLHPEELPELPPPSSEEGRELSRLRDVSLLPPLPDGGANRLIESTELPIIHTVTHTSVESVVLPVFPTRQHGITESTIAQARTSNSSEANDTSLSKAVQISETSSLQSKQRLAGHTAKIRLQNASATAHIADLPEERRQEMPKANEQAINAGYKEMDMTSTHLPAMGVWRKETNMSSTRLPAVDAGREEVGGTSVHVPAVSVANRTRSALLQKPLSGSGAFEYGQSDVIVTNPAITASSVVLVTLTTNPGPVVVQYISLQPRVGFTVHLTAPTSTRTTFNYIILQGEPL